MPPAYFSATVIALTLILSATILSMSHLLSKILEKQNQMAEKMVNLAASKDLTTFQHLQMMPTNQNPETDELHSPMNDAVAAERLAKHFADQGLDPSLAYAQSDDEMLADFGGPEAFRTH